MKTPNRIKRSGVRNSETDISVIDRGNDQSVTVDGTFNGKTEEGVIVDILAARTAFRGAQRTATGESASHQSSNSDDETLFHNFLSNVNCCPAINRTANSLFDSN